MHTHEQWVDLKSFNRTKKDEMGGSLGEGNIDLDWSGSFFYSLKKYARLYR